MVAGPASAGGPVNFASPYTTNGGGTSTWTVDDLTNSECYQTLTPIGYTPALDATVNGMNDAYDGGAIVYLSGKPYVDGDATGDYTDDTLSTGPSLVAHLTVSRKDRFDQLQPMLRSVVKVTNKGHKERKVQLGYVSNLGSDSTTTIPSTSSGDGVFEPEDRWIVTGDSSTGTGNLDDPSILHALWGKGAPIKGKYVYAEPGQDCVFVTFVFRLQGRSTASLMFFEYLDPTDEGAIDFGNDALGEVIPKNSRLVSGITPKARAQIVNWKFGEAAH